MLLDFDDLLILPEVLTDISSRKEVSVYDSNGMLPLFTAPMDTVINESNWMKFNENKIYSIIPRGMNKDIISIEERKWYSYGLDEFNEIFIDSKKYHNTEKTFYALIDIANGHMIKLFEIAKKAKQIYGDKLVLMVGNVANPKTYEEFAKIGVDYIRLGIGNGAGCFHENTKITTNNGYKEIALIEEGEEVLTHMNTYEKVVGKTSYIAEENCIKINNEIISTYNHEFYVIHKDYENIITDENIHNYAKWIPAEKLSEEYLLIELE